MKKVLVLALTTVLLGGARTSYASPILFGGLGGHSNGDSTNDGSLATINQATGVATIVGHPAGVNRISGLTFDLNGTLLGATLGAGGFPPPPGPITTSNLISINPANGALLSSVAVTAGG